MLLRYHEEMPVPRALKFRQPVSLEVKMRTQRRAPRMNSRVPLRVEWAPTSSEAPQQENAQTRVVNYYGCLLVSPQAMPLEQKLRITNLATKQSMLGVVVWQGKKQLEGWELGVELVQPQADFWGMEI